MSLASSAPNRPSGKDYHVFRTSHLGPIKPPSPILGEMIRESYQLMVKGVLRQALIQNVQPGANQNAEDNNSTSTHPRDATSMRRDNRVN
uniref:Uncharacterized protein n=1 Tax=Steinernema glaseri TaxID=37863 RepID=A0A1I7Z622_9BILA